MIFANPAYLYLLLLLVPLLGWYIWKMRRNQASMQIPSSRAFVPARTNTWKVYLRHLPHVLRMAAIACLIVVLARPQSTDNWQNSTTEGIDIILAIDISTSMLAEDLKPNRLEASKNVAAAFINGRRNDNIGLVVFSGESFTQCPLTTDHAILLNLFKDIRSGMIEDGTAIGLGLANAVSRIKDSQAISKVIILLTDGSNNRGEIAPVTAAEIARTFGIRVYAIGVGTKGEAPYPFQTAFGVRYQNIPVDIDEPTLKQIAATTGGQYFRATDNTSLKAIYAEIDRMEKTKISVQEFSKKQEEYRNIALLVFALLLLEMLLRYTLFKKIP
ncbi:MAG: VWA domain-containing protein [Tannerella sp.]|jgi:Ca-activated chloride channel family protein|nr:VWA domain-containing protein [Tannerella sp.]